MGAKKKVNQSDRYWNPLRSMSNPQRVLLQTVNTVRLLLGGAAEAAETWSEAVKVFESSGKRKSKIAFTQKLLDFDVDGVSVNAISKLDEMFAEEKEWTWEEVNGKSPVAGVLYQWIKAVYDVNKRKREKRDKLLTEWDLIDFAPKLEEFQLNDPMRWIKISDNDLVDKLEMKDDAVQKWKDGVTEYDAKLKERRTKVLRHWDLDDIAENIENSDFADPVIWPMIPKDIYKGEWGLNSEQRKKWNKMVKALDPKQLDPEQKVKESESTLAIPPSNAQDDEDTVDGDQTQNEETGIVEEEPTLTENISD